MRKLASLIFLLIAVIPLAARDYIRIGHSHEDIKFADLTTYYIDTVSNLTVEKFATSEFDLQLKQHTKKVYNFQTMRHAVWMKAFFICDTSGTFFIRVSPPLLDHVSVYSCESEQWVAQPGGYFATHESIQFPAPVWVFSFHGNAGDTVPIIIRVKSDMPMIYNLYAADAQKTAMVLDKLTLWNGLFLGIMLLMILYNLFLFVTSKQTVYVHYVFYMLSAGLFVSLASGSANVLPEWVRSIHSFSLTLIPACFGVFGMLFTRKFLNTPTYYKRFDLWLYVLIPSSLGTFVICIIDRQWGGTSIQILGGLFSIVSIYAGAKVWRAGYKPAAFYVLGFGSYMVCLLTYILLGVIDIDTGEFAPYWLLMIGSATEAVILSFAIGDKLNSANKQKLEADRAKLEALKENERIVREQNTMLERKVDERTAEINYQKSIIEEKNKDILDSIHYAKRIQSALLASETLLNENLSNYFVLYKPKDIVSGDFYWADKSVDGKFMFLTGDCTGHGVPGAFMSLLNISLLHELSAGQSVSRPDWLLNRQREAIISALNPLGSAEVSKDGMDCVLMSFDFANMKLEFACANNPLWIVRDGAVIEFKADKQPIGLHEGASVPYTLHSFELKIGDTVYVFTDGFADQFGGPKGKKFKYRQLQELLISNAELPMNEQASALENAFSSWKGNLEQVDDVLVIGVRV